MMWCGGCSDDSDVRVIGYIIPDDGDEDVHYILRKLGTSPDYQMLFADGEQVEYTLNVDRNGVKTVVFAHPSGHQAVTVTGETGGT
jgi:cold shock CspA family protein